MRLAWFTPLPPMPSGISDYSAELLPLVAEGADVEAFSPHGRAPGGIRTRRPDRFDPAGFDAVIYHLGNNPQHGFVYRAAMGHPGIAVLHDLVLHHLVAYEMVEAGHQLDRYRRTLIEEHGRETGVRLAWLKVGGVADEFDKFTFPLTGHVARRSAGVVVHSDDARARVEEVAPGVPVVVIPHHAGRPPATVAGVGRHQARRRLGLPGDAFIAGHFGFVSRPKQPNAVLGGMALLRARRPDAQLVVVGPDTTGGGLGRIIARHGLDEAVRATGFVDLERFYLYLKAVDVVINLRYPSAGESSGTLARALAEGRAVIVNNYRSFGELPDEAALKVEIDRPQAEQVGAHLIRLATDPALKERLETGARGYAATVLDPERCARAYTSFAASVSGSTAETRQ